MSLEAVLLVAVHDENLYVCFRDELVGDLEIELGLLLERVLRVFLLDGHPVTARLRRIE